jgi:hypothetical protein
MTNMDAWALVWGKVFIFAGVGPQEFGSIRFFPQRLRGALQISFNRIPFTSASVISGYLMVMRGLKWLNPVEPLFVTERANR